MMNTTESFFKGLRNSYEDNNDNTTYALASAEPNDRNILTAGSDFKQVYQQVTSLKQRYSSASMQLKLLFVFIPNIINLIENIILLAITLPALLFKGLYNSRLMLKVFGNYLKKEENPNYTDNEIRNKQDIEDTAACIQLEMIAVGLNLLNTMLAIVNPITRNLLTLRYGYDNSKEEDDVKIKNDALNTLKGPVEMYLLGRVNRFFAIADEQANAPTVTQVQTHQLV